jgi:hypothetical protein
MHTVQNVIVTTTDHDFVDVSVKRSGSVLSKVGKAIAGAALALAASAALASPASASTLTTTYHHPFYDVTQSAFVEASKLRSGDQLQSTDGDTATITGLRLYHSTTVTYDLTINGLHTYYVEAGTTSVLVHNCDGTLNWSRATVNDGGVDAVQRHLERFTGDSSLEPAEQGMVDRLRSVASGDLEPTAYDMRFYTHELRESVLYRQAGYPSGQPDDDSYELWDMLHTQALRDYGLTRAGAPHDLYHPSVR